MDLINFVTMKCNCYNIIGSYSGIAKLLLSLVLVCSIISCTGDRQGKHCIVNDNIHDYFYGLRLGCSSEDAIEELKDGDFKLLSKISTKEFEHFEPILRDSFVYEGLRWRMLDLNVTEGKVMGISFVNSFSNESKANNAYLNVEKWALKRYKPMMLKPKGEHLREIIFMGNDDIAGGLTLLRYKSVGGDSLFAVQLAYLKKPHSK